ncbi:HIT family hydrolase, partial [Isoptericola variabilis]
MTGPPQEHEDHDGIGADVPATVPAADVGPPEDGLQRLWTPHRMVYIGGQDTPADGSVAQCP